MTFAKDKNDLTPEAVSCRGLGHLWKPYTAKWYERANLKFKGYNVTLVCDRGCGTSKHFMLSQRGEYFPATYTYGDRYLLEKGNDPITREDRGQFKLEALSDWLPTNVSDITSTRKKRA